MSETKICPHCGGVILSVAIKCKHCGHWLSEDNVVSSNVMKCPICDEDIPTSSVICPQCGENISDYLSKIDLSPNGFMTDFADNEYNEETENTAVTIQSQCNNGDSSENTNKDITPNPIYLATINGAKSDSNDSKNVPEGHIINHQSATYQKPIALIIIGIVSVIVLIVVIILNITSSAGNTSNVNASSQVASDTQKHNDIVHIPNLITLIDNYSFSNDTSFPKKMGFELYEDYCVHGYQYYDYYLNCEPIVENEEQIIKGIKPGSFVITLRQSICSEYSPIDIGLTVFSNKDKEVVEKILLAKFHYGKPEEGELYRFASNTKFNEQEHIEITEIARNQGGYIFMTQLDCLPYEYWQEPCSLSSVLNDKDNYYIFKEKYKGKWIKFRAKITSVSPAMFSGLQLSANGMSIKCISYSPEIERIAPDSEVLLCGKVVDWGLLYSLKLEDVFIFPDKIL